MIFGDAKVHTHRPCSALQEVESAPEQETGGRRLRGRGFLPQTVRPLRVPHPAFSGIHLSVPFFLQPPTGRSYTNVVVFSAVFVSLHDVPSPHERTSHDVSEALALCTLLLLSSGSLRAQDETTATPVSRRPWQPDRLLVRRGSVQRLHCRRDARRLTSDIGYEAFARFSPDGKEIAFTGQYDGNTEVYLMSAEGSVPRRLTTTATLDRDYVSDRMGQNNIVMAWQNDTTIVYRSRQREANDFKGQLFSVSRNGGLSEQLPLPRGGFCSFSPDGSKMAYNRVFREFRTWKRYRGGMADDISIYDFATRQTARITDNPAQDIIPMWSGQKIYFLSDRDSLGRMNLYVHELSTTATRKITSFTDYDVKYPSIGQGAIVFEQGGSIFLMDLSTEEVRRVPIAIREDFAVGRGGLRTVDKEVTNYEIAPDGSRALFGARGDVFTVPAEYGPTRNITATPGVHERNSKWSPDGRWIAYISDATGEDEIYICPAGRKWNSPADHPRRRYLQISAPVVPGQQETALGDKKLRLQYVDIDSTHGHARGAGDGLGDHRLQLVSRQPVDCLRPPGREDDDHGEPLLP